MTAEVLPKILLTIGITACILFSFVYVNQEKLIFHPERLSTDHRFSCSVPFEEIVLDSGGVGIHSLLFPKESSQGVILYFHGNAGSLHS